MQEAWRAQTAGGPRELARKIVAASERYLQILAKGQKVLEARADARGVEQVKAEKNRVLSDPQVREALAVLQAPTPVASARPDQESPRVSKGNPTSIEPCQPNEFTFSPVEARFVRLFIHTSQQGAPGVDELEVFGPEGDVNLALAAAGGRASASSCIAGFAIHKISHLNDGKYGNAHSWIAQQEKNEWAQIELPRSLKVSRVVFSRDRLGGCSDRVPVHCEIQLSDNGRTWRTVAQAGLSSRLRRR